MQIRAATTAILGGVRGHVPGAESTIWRVLLLLRSFGSTAAVPRQVDPESTARHFTAGPESRDADGGAGPVDRARGERLMGSLRRLVSASVSARTAAGAPAANTSDSEPRASSTAGESATSTPADEEPGPEGLMEDAWVTLERGPIDTWRATVRIGDTGVQSLFLSSKERAIRDAQRKLEKRLAHYSEVGTVDPTWNARSE